MLRSNINTEKSDFTKIKEEDHSNEVWKTIEKNIPIFFEKIIEGGDELAALKSNPSFKVQSSSPDIRKHLSEIFEAGVTKYDKVSKKYHKFFSEESMHEFEDEDNPKDFRDKLAKDVPIINKALQSKYDAMKDWQQKFWWASPSDIYSICFNLIDFMNDYVNKISSSEFLKFNEVTKLDRLYTLNEDDDYNVPGVIGMGIKSSILFHLNQKYFLGANKNTLYGFYFLSECEHFHLPSRTNEFVMTNDLVNKNKRDSKSNNLIDQNYWYPYDLFMLYGIRTYNKLRELCAKYKYTLDDAHRFVHVNSFMSEIWDIEYDKINTMTGGDQEDAR